MSVDPNAQGTISATAVCQPDPINTSMSYCGYAHAACTTGTDCDYGSCSNGHCAGYLGDACSADTDCQAFFFCGTDGKCGGTGAACANGDASAPIPSPDQQCVSQSCDTTTKTCAAAPAAGVPNGFGCSGNTMCASGFCSTASVCSLAASPQARRKRSTHVCPANQVACSTGLGDGYECIDSQTNLEQCGGCVADGTGVDCTAIFGVESVECDAGKCICLVCLGSTSTRPRRLASKSDRVFPRSRFPSFPRIHLARISARTLASPLSFHFPRRRTDTAVQQARVKTVPLLGGSLAASSSSSSTPPCRLPSLLTYPPSACPSPTLRLSPTSPIALKEPVPPFSPTSTDTDTRARPSRSAPGRSPPPVPPRRPPYPIVMFSTLSPALYQCPPVSLLLGRGPLCCGCTSLAPLFSPIVRYPHTPLDSLTLCNDSGLPLRADYNRVCIAPGYFAPATFMHPEGLRADSFFPCSLPCDLPSNPLPHQPATSPRRQSARPPCTLANPLGLRPATRTDPAMAPSLTPFGNAVVGAVGGVFSGAVVYPLDTIKTRIQTEHAAIEEAIANSTAPPSLKRSNAPHHLPHRHATARQMALRIFKEGGALAFYRGFGANMLNTFSMQFAYFYFYTLVRSTYIKKFPLRKMTTATELALGAIAAAMGQIFTIPVSVIATRQQLAKKTLSFRKAIAHILRDDGITGLWRGLKPSLVLCVNPAITYGMFERLKTMLLKPGEKMTPFKAFLIGAMSKTLATVVTYPYIMAKTRLQAGNDDDDDTPPGQPKERYNGALDCLKQVYAEEGFTGWYQGMQAQITKAVLSQALLFGIKDALEAYTILSLVAYSKVRGSAVGLTSI
ncbi:Peroxisomal adenine nucleotide transporter 1 [Rhodotorula toruloides]|nr:Peroxisomal adenine nucleotide transporter 1 [Rhodotorula toruloides]